MEGGLGWPSCAAGGAGREKCACSLRWGPQALARTGYLDDMDLTSHWH